MSETTLRAVSLVALLTLAVVVGSVAFAGGAAAADGLEYEGASPSTVDAGSTHAGDDAQTLNFSVTRNSSGTAQDYIYIDLEMSNITPASVRVVGVNTNLEEDIQYSSELVEGYDGDDDVDSIELTVPDGSSLKDEFWFEPVFEVAYQNSSEDHVLEAGVIVGDKTGAGSGGDATGTFDTVKIRGTGSDDSTTTTETTTTASAETTVSEDTTATTSESGGTPGFGVGIALLALLAAGALAIRREMS